MVAISVKFRQKFGGRRMAQIWWLKAGSAPSSWMGSTPPDPPAGKPLRVAAAEIAKFGAKIDSRNVPHCDRTSLLFVAEYIFGIRLNSNIRFWSTCFFARRCFHRFSLLFLRRSSYQFSGQSSNKISLQCTCQFSARVSSKFFCSLFSQSPKLISFCF